MAGPSLTPSPKAAMLRPLLLALSALAFVAVALASGASLAAPTFPPLTGRVVDEAQILSPQSTAEIAAKLNALEAKSSDQLVVFIAKSLQGYAIEDYGYQLGRAWGIGQKGLDNGVLLIVVPSERKVRIEVGRGLEPQLTDAMSTLIIQNTILPAFREGRFADGIREGRPGYRERSARRCGGGKAARSSVCRPATPATSSEIIALFVVGGLDPPFLLQVLRELAEGAFRARKAHLAEGPWRQASALAAGWAPWATSFSPWASPCWTPLAAVRQQQEQ